jgi:hypothetical protein
LAALNSDLVNSRGSIPTSCGRARIRGFDKGA